MDKKDIYEHLAKIYLDASAKKVKKRQEYTGVKTFLIAAVASIFAVTAFFLLYAQNKNKTAKSRPPMTSELALVLSPSIVKINFNFEPVKKESFIINLNNLDLNRFKQVKFYVRKANLEDDILLNVEFINSFNEVSKIYLLNLSAYKWQEYKIDLADFKDISDWTQMSHLSFNVEGSSSKAKKSIVYIDNIRVVK